MYKFNNNMVTESKQFKQTNNILLKSREFVYLYIYNVNKIIYGTETKMFILYINLLSFI